MSSSSASLFYGITVNIHDLIRGARAFAKFTKNAVVLDLLLARKKPPTTGAPVSCTSRHCHLSSADKLSTLPAELLVLIRDHLRHSYITVEPSYWIHELHWDLYAGGEADSNLARGWQKPWTEAMWDWHSTVDECDLCVGTRFGTGDVFHDISDAACNSSSSYPCRCGHHAIEVIRQLLDHVDLSLPTRSYFNVAYESDPRFFNVAISLPVARENAAEEGFCASEDHKTALSYHDVPYEEPDLQTATYFDPSYFQTSEDDDRKSRRLVQDLELRIAKVEGGIARRWTKEQVEERSRTMEKKVGEKEAEERRRGRAEGGKDVESVLVKEGAQSVQPRWISVQTSIWEY